MPTWSAASPTITFGWRSPAARPFASRLSGQVSIAVPSMVSRLLLPTHRARTKTGGQIWAAALLLALHQSQGIRGLETGRGSPRHYPQVPRPAQRARHWRNRLEQELTNGVEGSRIARGPRRPSPAAYSRPHASSRG